MTRRSLSVLVLVLVLAVAGCGGSSDAKGPTATIGSPKTTERPSTTTAKPATPEAEVEAAYLKSWDVYAKAMRTFDTSKLDTAFAKDALSLRMNEVARIKKANTPVRMDADHHIDAVRVEGDKAKLLDDYINHSVLLDAKTGEPTEAIPNTPKSRTYSLERIDGSWYVTFVLDNEPRSSSSSSVPS